MTPSIRRAARRSFTTTAIALGWLAAAGCRPSKATAGRSSDQGSGGLPSAASAQLAPAVVTEGRFERAEGDALTFAWSGSRVSARFEGPSVAVELDDAHGSNRFHVVVDGQLLPDKIAAQPGAHGYPLASGLGPGAHEVSLYRLTEASQGETKFLGFRWADGGRLLPYGPGPSRRIEIIGDSISTGYGNEGADKTCPFTPDTENHYFTYGALAARHFGAALTTIAWSGKGVWTNRGNTADPLVMPILWKRTLPEREGSRWRFSDDAPDVVVLNLGSNDFAPTVKDWSPFAAAYLVFLEEVRARYRDAVLICAVGPVLSDAWPEGRHALSTARRAIADGVSARRAAGDGKVHSLEFAQQTGANGYGCDWHPNRKTHEIMAARLIEELESRMGWSPAR